MTCRLIFSELDTGFRMSKMKNTLRRIKPLVLSLFLLSFASAQASPAEEMPLTGRWKVKFTFAGRSDMNLILDAKAKGSGSFLLLDTTPDFQPETTPRSASWLQTTNNRFGFSGEVELPIGTCCRETGTLIFKGEFESNNSIQGKVIFVGSTEEEENPIGFRAMLGTFTAKRQ
jgi:hypothetical protein